MISRVVAIAALVLAAPLVHAQAYPNHPVRLVVGYAPGGAADTVARAMSAALSKALGQPVIVDNKAGAGSSIAADFVAKAAPDGYTILLASPSNISVNPALNPALPYKASDLAPVIKVTSAPLIIAVGADSPIHSVKDLIEAARTSPGRINYATSGVGSMPHLGAALFAQRANLQMVHVPFKGGAPAVQSVMAGDTQVTFATAASITELIKAGKLRGLAVSTRDRSPLVPYLPGMAESGFEQYQFASWYGLFVPAGTPDDVRRKIFAAAAATMHDDNVKQVLARDGTDVDLSTSSAQFASFLENDNVFWADLVRSAGVTKD